MAGIRFHLLTIVFALLNSGIALCVAFASWPYFQYVLGTMLISFAWLAIMVACVELLITNPKADWFLSKKRNRMTGLISAGLVVACIFCFTYSCTAYEADRVYTDVVRSKTKRFTENVIGWKLNRIREVNVRNLGYCSISILLLLLARPIIRVRRGGI